jgi:hypothetical protein
MRSSCSMYLSISSTSSSEGAYRNPRYRRSLEFVARETPPPPWINDSQLASQSDDFPKGSPDWTDRTAINLPSGRSGYHPDLSMPPPTGLRQCPYHKLPKLKSYLKIGCVFYGGWCKSAAPCPPSPLPAKPLDPSDSEQVRNGPECVYEPVKAAEAAHAVAARAAVGATALA